ncbi:hypothetical protein [Weissella cibaria]|uniref:hypothetical protein n=1 Tax=Weissella cibaria TaxID=137591 RepID=UPI00106EEE2B|nr:hypothetical protein [Weissella cibaria]
MRRRYDDSSWGQFFFDVRGLPSFFGKFRRLQRLVDWSLAHENILHLKNWDELPRVVVDKVDDFNAVLSLSIVDDKTDVMLKLAPAISAAFRGRVGAWVARPGYVSDDENWVRYELVDSSHSYQLRPEKLADYRPHGDEIKLDQMHSVHASSNSGWIIAGSTGSGKSIEALNILLQFMLMRRRSGKDSKGESKVVEAPLLYGVDFKRGEMAKLFASSDLPRENWTTGAPGEPNVSYVLDLVIEQHEKRQAELSNVKSITANSWKIGHAPVVLILEEFGSGLATLPKKEAEDVVRKVKLLAMQGRSSLSGGIILISQQASAQGTGLTTDILQQFSNKIGKGRMRPQERQYLMPGFELSEKAWPKNSGWGYLFNDALNVPVEYRGMFPNRPNADEWLGQAIIKAINKNIAINAKLAKE